MKIGARLTVITVTLVMLTLGLYGFVTVRNRRSELSADSARRLSALGGLTRVTLEATLKDRHVEEIGPLLARWQATVPDIRLTYIELQRSGRSGSAFRIGDESHADMGHVDAGAADMAEAPGGTRAISVSGDAVYLPPSRDPTRQLRLQRVVVEGLPYGEAVEIDDLPVYAVMEPIHDANGRIVAALELVREESETVRAMHDSVSSALYAVGGLSLMLALLVWLSANSTLSSPLKRLVEAVDDVTRGDLGRVILRERDDEVGDLAERFNEMTGSLREARREILDGVDAKLALEARLRQSEKLATIGQLAAGIAHEVGTPLNVINGRARNMEKRADEAMRQEGVLRPEDVAKNAGIIAAQTQRITKIIQQLLDFARRPQRVRAPVELGRVVHDAVDFLDQQLEQAGITVVQAPYVCDPHETDALSPPPAPVVVGDADQLQQVVLNLCVNAIHAMPRGGTLSIALRGQSRRRPGLETASPLRFVVLALRDTGVGIPEADRERIFEPFYSTKTEAEGPTGTGLGLAVSNGIVKDHDGWIELDAPAAGGTEFRVFLPADG